MMGDTSEEMKEGAKRREYQLLYITPELLIGRSEWRKLLLGDVYRNQLVAFIVDEAHTVKKFIMVRFNFL